MTESQPEGLDRAGVWFAVAAYGMWGIAPVYFKLIGFASPAEVVAHRVVWSVLVLALVIWLRGLWPTVRALTRRQLGGLVVSGVLISVNWLVFIWAVLNGRLLDASLGYFINPLVNVVLGVLLFREWLRPAQKVALLLAAVGVANEVLALGTFPWIGLALALSFGLYGTVRKHIGVGSAVGLALETTLMLPLALGYLMLSMSAGTGTLANGSASQWGLLFASGPITVAPLVCFAAAAIRLPLSVLGFFQYLAPSLMFVLAVLVYGEPLRTGQLLTFGCIWLALLVFSGDAFYRQRRLRNRPAGVAP